VNSYIFTIFAFDCCGCLRSWSVLKIDCERSSNQYFLQMPIKLMFKIFLLFQTFDNFLHISWRAIFAAPLHFLFSGGYASAGNLIICAPKVIKHAYCITGRKVVLWFMAAFSEAYPIIKCI
jgi:hypothetical protein